jgi:hypothetical protein
VPGRTCSASCVANLECTVYSVTGVYIQWLGCIFSGSGVYSVVGLYYTGQTVILSEFETGRSTFMNVLVLMCA